MEFSYIKQFVNIDILEKTERKNKLMLMDYINESADILDNKVESGELTIEAAVEAYNDILDKATNEFVEDVLESVDEGILTPIEANFLFEMAGLLDDGDEAFVEAPYDLSGLSPAEKQEIDAKLRSLSPSQRKAAVEALAKKFPSKETKDAENALAEKDAKRAAAKEKRNRMIRTAAKVGGAVALGAAGAYAGSKIKQNADEKRSINENNPAYTKLFKAKDEAIKKLNDSDEFKDYLNRNAPGALGAGARLRLSKKAPSEVAMLGDAYKAQVDAINRDFKGKLGEAVNKERQSEGYRQRVKDQASLSRNLDKETKKQMKRNAKYAQMDAQWYASNNLFGLGRKAKSAGASALNAPTKLSNTVNNFLGKTDKVKDLKHKETGVFKSGVDKNASKNLEEMNKKAVASRNELEANINKKARKEAAKAAKATKAAAEAEG